MFASFESLLWISCVRFAMFFPPGIHLNYRSDLLNADAELAVQPQRLGFSELGCVTGEDIVAIFRRRVAGEAGLVQRLVSRLPVLKVSEAPAARRGVLL